MRVLTEYELNLVAGGSLSSEDDRYSMSWFDPASNEYVAEAHGPDIVVQGFSMGYADANFFANSMFGGNTEYGAGSANASTDWFTALLEDVVAPIVTWVLDRAVKTPEKRDQDERTVAGLMHTADIAAHGAYTTVDGRSGTMWNMKDGSVFWDTNNNGKPDYHTWYETDGHLYGDDGSGVTQLK